MKATTRHKKYLIVGLAVLLFGSFGLFLAVRHFHFGPIKCHKGGLYYYAAIRSEVIRNFPVQNPRTEAIYYSEPGDGPAAPELGVRYVTSSDWQLLIKNADTYLRQRGFEGGDEGHDLGTRVYTKHNQEITLTVVPFESGGVQVFVTQIDTNWYGGAEQVF